MKGSRQSEEIASLTDLLRRHAMDPNTSWSCGSFGAIAEFAWEPGEAIRFEDAGAVIAATPRGAIRIEPREGVRAIAYELAGRDVDSRQHGVALCLPEAGAGMTRRTVVAELGPDREAIRPEDRTAILFDLGLNTIQADICVRTADPAIVACLRAAVGSPFLTPGNRLVTELVRLSPHRVFCCRFGRIEVFQPIPPAGGTSPDGPHTHVLPRLLAQGRTHAANLPLPDGWVPCMTLFPPSPIRTASGTRKPFDRAQFEAFQSLWSRHGDPQLVALKKTVLPVLLKGGGPQPLDEASATRAARTVIRVAARQAKHLAISPAVV